jgi:cell division transport system permease protein
MSTLDSSLPVLVQPRTGTQFPKKFARKKAPIVPPGSVAGRSLTLVIAIMCFLASLTAGGVYLVIQSAHTWMSNIANEMTVQVQVKSAGDGDKEVAEISQFLKGQIGISKVTPFTRQQSLELVQPWLGDSDVLKNFAIPRLIAIEVDRDTPPDTQTLAKVVKAKFPGALLDDHRLWKRQIQTVTQMLATAGLAIIALMAAATIAIIIAAARSALASNREIVEVLNLVGAEERFIARQFEVHFLKVGIRAGIVGASLAALVFFLIPLVGDFLGSGSVATNAEVRRLVGAGTLDLWGYLTLVIVVLVIAAICQMTSRLGVRRILNQQSL